MSFVARLLCGGRIASPPPALLFQFRGVPRSSLLSSGFQTAPRLPLLRFSSTVGSDVPDEDQSYPEDDSDIEEFALRVAKGAKRDEFDVLEERLEEDLAEKKAQFYYDETPIMTLQERADVEREGEMRELDEAEVAELREERVEPWGLKDPFLEERLRGEKLKRKDGNLYVDEDQEDIGPARYPSRHLNRLVGMVESDLFESSQNKGADYQDMTEREKDEAVLRHVEKNKEGLTKGLVDLIHTMMPMTGKAQTHRAPAGEEEKLSMQVQDMQEWVEGVARLFHAQMYGPTKVDDKRAVMRVARAMRHVLLQEGGARTIEQVKRNEGTLERKGRLAATKVDVDAQYSDEEEDDLARERQMEAQALLSRLPKISNDDVPLDENTLKDNESDDGESTDDYKLENEEDYLSRISDGDPYGDGGEATDPDATDLEALLGEGDEKVASSSGDEQLKLTSEEEGDYLGESEEEELGLADRFQDSDAQREILISLLDNIANPYSESDLFCQQQQEKTRLTDLTYFHLYPKPAQQWVIDAKTPIGFYDFRGYWSPMDVTERLLRHSRQKMRESADRYLQLRLKQGVGEGAYPVFPKDLKGHYRFGLKPEEVAEMDFEEKTHRVLSFAYATQREINKFRVQQAIKKYGRFPGDTGSDEAQFAVLTEKVFALTEHFRANHKDYAKKRHFGRLLARRQKVMNRLKYSETATYFEILRDFRIPDTGRAWKMSRTGGIQIPKKCRMSKQKRARLVKGKSVSQKSFALAAAKKGTRK